MIVKSLKDIQELYGLTTVDECKSHIANLEEQIDELVDVLKTVQEYGMLSSVKHQVKAVLLKHEK